MSYTSSKRFDSFALYASLDEERCRRGMSWSAVASEIGIAFATITRVKDGGFMESDGVRAMTRWLGRPLEAFSQTNRNLAGANGTGAGRIQTQALYLALDERRRSRAMTWTALAKESGVGASQLTRLSKGGRIEAHLLLTVAAWLGRDVESFARVTDW